MLTKETVSMLSELSGLELQAESDYRMLSVDLQAKGYFGAAKYFAMDAKEEYEHYCKLNDFFNSLGIRIESKTITPERLVDISIGSALDYSYNKELELLKEYSEYYSKCTEPIAYPLLFEMINIQCKSVGKINDLKVRYNNVSECAGGILIFDKEMLELSNGL